MILLHVKTRDPQKHGSEGMMPAVAYGQGGPATSLSVSQSDFLRLFRDAKYSALFDLSIDDAEPVKALIQDVQFHPVTMDMVHADFRLIRMDQPLEVSVPLHFEGESDAVKLGGTLLHVMEEARISCLPKDLPKSILVDVSRLKTLEDRITLGDLPLPAGVQLLQATEELVAAVEAPRSAEEQKRLEEGDIGDVAAVQAEGDASTEDSKDAAGTDAKDSSAS